MASCSKIKFYVGDLELLLMNGRGKTHLDLLYLRTANNYVIT